MLKTALRSGSISGKINVGVGGHSGSELRPTDPGSIGDAAELPRVEGKSPSARGALARRLEISAREDGSVTVGVGGQSGSQPRPAESESLDDKDGLSGVGGKSPSTRVAPADRLQ